MYLQGNAMDIPCLLYTSIICLLFLDPILRFFGASDQTLIYAHEYLSLIHI